MPISARRVLGVVVAVLGVVVAVFGSWTAFKLGPTGAARFSVAAKAPGALVVAPDVLNSVDVPVRVRATRSDGGAVRLAVAASTDARAVLATSAVSTVSGVSFPAGRLGLRASGAGPLAAAVNSSDVWRLSASGKGSAELVVDQDRAPETAVVTSGDATGLGDVTLTVTWANRTWFFQALAVAVIAAIIATFAINDLWQSRPQRISSLHSGPRHGR